LQVQHWLHPDEVSDLLTAYESGTTIAELAMRFQVHRHTVTKHLDRAGVPRRQEGLTPEQVGEATQLYLAGSSLAQIAQCFGVYPQSIRYRLQQAGVRLRPRPGWPTSE
jgi:transposase-like protein